MACAVETRFGRFRVRHPSLLPAVLECVRTLDRVSGSRAYIERRDCGTGAGGFKPGNKCGQGGDGSGDSGASGSVKVSQKGTFLQAETEGGVVGGHVKDGAVKISVAQLAKEKQGQGLGKAMYKSLIDEAHSQGLKVFSDSTVEVPAVRVYQSLAKDGYEIVTNDHGVLPPSEDAPQGAWFGTGGKPVFEVKPKSKRVNPQADALEASAVAGKE